MFLLGHDDVIIYSGMMMMSYDVRDGKVYKGVRGWPSGQSLPV